ncbi:MAG: 2-oxoacid:acceptor oxidoreductase family protein [Clostridia bacterium]|nr:2-oxoacid:acceptor oxidoreductase family protein [Clostridia bacterium]
MIQKILFAGFGGQGVLFAGKTLAYAGMDNEMQISWLPSYGPEMRGGTANCSVILSDEPIGSPVITAPDVLVAMNKPSLEKFENTVAPGGLIVLDSFLIDKKVERDDVDVVYIPAKQLAGENGNENLGNMIMLGAALRHRELLAPALVHRSIEEHTPQTRAELAGINKKMIDIGYQY